VIKAIRYHKETRDNSTARILNTVRFGPLGGLLTRDKKVAEIAIDYIMPSTQALALKSATAPTAWCDRDRQPGTEADHAEGRGAAQNGSGITAAA
jgi:hypothetical protein